jgi:D-alanyl-D-alanine carboxypeptidase
MRGLRQLIVPVLFCFSAAALGQYGELENTVRQAALNGGDGAGFSLSVYSPSASYSVQAGLRNPGTNFLVTEKTAFRIASITKTYVASTVLRLWEEGLVDLQAPVSELIDPTFDQWLRGDGYDTDRILLIHLLTHTGGMFDHAQDARYIAEIIEDPAREWTRETQVKACVDWGDPVGEPGELYSYSDTGYLLVGHVVERITGRSLAASVRQWLNFEKLGIKQTYWEQFEKAPLHLNRAHQFYESTDVAELPDASSYRIGIFEHKIDGKTTYGHSGFWGTLVRHDPATNTTIAGAVIRGSDYEVLKNLIVDAIED